MLFCFFVNTLFSIIKKYVFSSNAYVKFVSSLGPTNCLMIKMVLYGEKSSNLYCVISSRSQYVSDAH